MGAKERRHWGRSISISISTSRHRDISASSAGCMGGMLHYFDFHHILFNSTATVAGHATATTHDSDFSSPIQTSTKGVEAPRNSLDLEAQQLTDTDQLQPNTSSSSSSLLQEDHYFDIPLAGVQLAPAFDIFPPKIKRHSRKLSLLGDKEDRRVGLSVSDTPETPRTPSLVARLMGIDGLPDPAPSPPATARQKKLTSKNIELKKRELPSSSKLQETSKKEPRQPLRNININCHSNARFSDVGVGCHSLPDTPRVSSARSSWDVDARHSLQLHRENLNSSHSNVNVNNAAVGDYSLPPSPTHYYSRKPRRKYQDENRSPRSREFVKEIVKQMKETISNRRELSGREDTLINVKSSRSSKVPEVEKQDGSSRSKPALTLGSVSPPSPQPISALLSTLSKTTTKAKLQDHIPNLHELPKPVRVKPSRPPPPPPVAVPVPVPVAAAVAVPIAVAVPVAAGGTGKCNKGVNERFTARLKKPASTTSGCLGTVSVTGDKTFSIGIEKSEFPPKLLIRSPHPQLKKDESAKESTIGKSWRTGPDEELEYKYVGSILERGGFMGGGSHGAKAKHYSAWHGVDPIVFHQLEVELPVDDRRYHGSGLRYRWNRKHLFHLVEEVLTDLLDGSSSISSKLDEKVWSEIERMRMVLVARSRRECEYLTLRDIDALVGMDMRERNIRELSRHRAVRREAREIGVEMEEEILEDLIGETAAELSSLSL